MPQSSTSHVFISYSRRDEAVMRRVVAFLRKQNLKVWVDNEKLIPGTPIWEVEIEKAIISAGAVVVLLSPDSKDSPWVRREISFAEDNDKRIFPLLVAGSQRDTVPIRLTNHQRIDIREDEEVGLNSLATALSFYLEDLETQERKAREEAAKLALAKAEQAAKQKAEEERLAREKPEAKRKANEEAKRVAAQKTEDERVAKAKETDRLAQEKRRSAEKAEAERKAREEANRVAAQRAEEERIAKERQKDTPDIIAQTPKKKEPAKRITTRSQPAKLPLPPIGIAGAAIIGILLCGYAAINLLRGFSTPAPPATEALVATEPVATEVPPTEAPTEVPILVSTPIGGGNGQIAFRSYRGGSNNIYIMNADGSNQSRLTSLDGSIYDLSWSPNGKQIAFNLWEGQGYEVYKMNVDGSELTRLTYNGDIQWSWGLAWSPDGKFIAYISAADGNPEIYLINSDGSEQRRLTNNFGSIHSPAWSPDGKLIAFVSNRDDYLGEIYIMNADASEKTRLTNNIGFQDGNPAWSPDGKQIAFNSSRDGNYEIYIMNVDGSGVTRLTFNETSDDFSPSWSPDGKLIAYVSSLDGNSEIYIMNVDGSGVTRLTSDAEDDIGAVWLPAE